MRFMPADIRDILPGLFNEKYGNNAQWRTMKILNTVVTDMYIEQLNRCLEDEEFQGFQESYM